jgi:hypothetical protein
MLRAGVCEAGAGANFDDDFEGFFPGPPGDGERGVGDEALFSENDRFLWGEDSLLGADGFIWGDGSLIGGVDSLLGGEGSLLGGDGSLLGGDLISWGEPSLYGDPSRGIFLMISACKKKRISFKKIVFQLFYLTAKIKKYIFSLEFYIQSMNYLIIHDLPNITKVKLTSCYVYIYLIKQCSSNRNSSFL